MLPQLPVDIIIHILHTLPVKSLVQFRCVCKSWNSLISNRNFIGMHLSRSTAAQQDDNYYILSSKESIGILHYQSSSLDCEAVRLDFPHPLNFYTMNRNHEVVGCCNGLLCILFKALSSLLIIWNPSTREYMRLPDPGFHIFDVYGFGYDSSLNDYKIVRFECGLSGVQVHTLGTNSRKEIEIEDELWKYSFISMRRKGTLLNGALYWLVRTKDDTKILRFDLIDDNVSLLPLPKEDVFCSTSKLGVYGESLCLFIQNNYNGRRPGDRSVHTWILKQDWTWSKLLIIPQPKKLPSDRYLSPIDFTKNGQVLMCTKPKHGIQYYMNGTTFSLYNPKKKRFKQLMIPGKDWQWSEKSLYVETLPAQILVSPTVGDKEVQAQRSHAACVQDFRKWFAKCCRKELPLILEPSLFGFEQSIYLSKDDVDELCKECGKPTSAMFVFYMKNLYAKMKAKMKKNGVNCNLAYPELICPDPEWKNPDDNILSKILDRNTPVIVPVHMSKPMEHWCLAMIVPFVDKERVFWFDSLNAQIERRCTEKIEDAINAYRVRTLEGRKKIIWEKVKCREQAGNWESGFYVMMFMRDILMRGKSIDFTKECLESCLTCYPTEQSVIDDVYLLKWELLGQYRVHHPEYKPERYY